MVNSLDFVSAGCLARCWFVFCFQALLWNRVPVMVNWRVARGDRQGGARRINALHFGGLNIIQTKQTGPRALTLLFCITHMGFGFASDEVAKAEQGPRAAQCDTKLSRKTCWHVSLQNLLRNECKSCLQWRFQLGKSISSTHCAARLAMTQKHLPFTTFSTALCSTGLHFACISAKQP